MPTPHGAIAVQWGYRPSGSEFAMHVATASSTSGTIAVPTYGRAIEVDVNGQTVWDGQTGSAYGAYSDGSYVYLDNVPGGDYQVAGHPAGPAAQSLSIAASPQSLALVAGHSATVTVNVSAQAPNTASGTITPSLPSGWSASPSQGSFTVDGQAGAEPDSVTFTVTAAKDARGGPVKLGFTASASGMTAQTSVTALPFGAWPSGTTATASSYHSPNTVNGQVRTYVPSNAIDGDLTTFWNDANPATYPAVLTITSPSAVTLPGIAFASFPDGVPDDFTVATWNGSSWVQQAQITGNDQIDRRIPFNSPVSTTQVRLTVTKDQATTSGEFTRVAELDP